MIGIYAVADEIDKACRIGYYTVGNFRGGKMSKVQAERTCARWNEQHEDHLREAVDNLGKAC